MQVSTLTYARTTRSALLAVAVAAIFFSGCDRSKPEQMTGAAKETPSQSGTSDPVLPPDTQPNNQAPGTQPPGNGNPKIDPPFANDGAPDTNLASTQPASTGATDSPADGSAELPGGARMIDQADLMNRAFMTLQPPKSDRPEDLVAYLAEVDVALRDLILAGTNNVVDAATFTNSGLRLGQLKLQAGERLAQATDATADQRKAGTISQLVALSHMSGLKDVESAKKLEKFATTLLQSTDPDLAHQGRVVLLGFRLQELQNGTTADPAALLAELEGLFQRPVDSGFPEMMVLQQSQQVLNEMGFKEAAAKIDQLMVSKFMDAPDPQLSLTAWSVAVANSQAFQNYNAALQDVYTGKETQPQMLLAAVRGLFNELPNATTLLQFLNLSTDLEYRGLVPFAEELTGYVKQQVDALKDSPFAAAIDTAIEAQNRRLGIRGRTIELNGLVDLDGNALDWSAYKGKVVLIDFWATWCQPCLKELPNIRQVHSDWNAKGFEVLSINMDDDLKPVRQYLSSNLLPWKTYHSSDLTALGFKSEIAKQFGITAIPFLVLVDAEGKVAAVHVRGDRLGPSVSTMLSSGLGN